MRTSKKGADFIDRLRVRLACIDDFAFRKGQRYGSVLVDIETKNVVDLLNSREYEDVKQWLDGFPNLKLISRDGSITYRKAISDSNEDIIQVSDRFHLLKNITEYAKKYIKRCLPVQIDVQMPSVQAQEPLELPEIKEKYKYTTKWQLIQAVQQMRKEGYTINQLCQSFGMSNRIIMAYCKILPEEKARYEALPLLKKSNVPKKQEIKAGMIQRAKEMVANGYSKQKISESMGVSERTVQRYLTADPSGRHGNTGRERRHKLDPFKNEVLALSAKGQSSSKIFSTIKELGYTGSASPIREFLLNNTIKMATSINESNVSRCKIDRSCLISLLYKDISQIIGFRHSHYLQIIDLYPELGKLFELLKEFKDLMNGANPSRLDVWIKAAKTMNISELNSFLTGVERDLSAIRNAIVFSYNNGLAEGTVNKIKVIKRIMYGRCGFQMLRRKVLLNNIN